MKNLLFLPVLLLSINSFSQFGFYSVGLESFQGTSYNTVNDPELSQAFHNEIPKYSYSIAITSEVFRTERIVISPSIGISNMGMRTPKTELTFGDMIDPQRGFQYSTEDAPATSRYIHNFYSANLSINLNYYITNGKTRLFAQLSPEFNYVTHYKHILKVWESNKLVRSDSDDRTESAEVSRTNFTLGGGIGVEMPLAKNLSIQTSVQYKQMLNTITPNWETKDKLYAFGLKLGVIYSL